ncbi:class I SAM-dependent methyltransferase [Rhizobium sp. SL42]|uniref:class I SAM-dependent methyltransferase n=1 Tax=Rhizobium sp. SL42 TaxID=2806346 RepID=UPI001F413E7F|nr:class I SAM-dependent methyltransferase [Rhizobium sp. SL42]UJW76260.1 class I SAM-dependent methyltransferase [Rhizobium sp. SL42]
MADEAHSDGAAVTPARDHWDNVYRHKAEHEVSWFEERPDLSLSLLRSAGIGLDVAVIDVGGGASALVDALIVEGQAHVTVLDLSAAALDRAQQRLPGVRSVDWVVADIRSWTPTRHFHAWHDRAAFHFLTEVSDQNAYVTVLKSALLVGGVAVIGTFAPDGPKKCSGLPVARHDCTSLQRLLGPDFDLLGSISHEHHTPSGSVQKFQFSTFRRRGAP